MASGGLDGGDDQYDDFSEQKGGGYKADPSGFADSNNDYSGGGGDREEKPKETYVPEDVPDENLFDFQINTGINFDKYAAIPVNVSDGCSCFSFTEFIPVLSLFLR